MLRPSSRAAVLLLFAVSACSTHLSGIGTTAPTPNGRRGIRDTKLIVDVSALTGSASITFAPSLSTGATLEIGDLTIERVSVAQRPLTYTDVGSVLILGLPANRNPITVDILYRWQMHDWSRADGFTGASNSGYTNTWPYYCGNLFPCHSDPADGSTFSLDIRGVPAGKSAIFASRIPTEAPAYQLAWSIGAYTELPLGTTTAGTHLSAWYRENELEAMQTGATYLVAAFDWFERNLGPYPYGNRAGPVAVTWPEESYGGIEHHPYWHIAGIALDNWLVHVHEAAHGWFGDGVRTECWEDFVLSEGTATYLAARALSVIAPEAGARAWKSYADQLAHVDPTLPVWPATCGFVDVLRDGLFSDAPYIRGAFFYKAVADKVGAERLDQALAYFFAQNVGSAARMNDMLKTIRAVTGYDPSACAAMWLRSEVIPQPSPCP